MKRWRIYWTVWLTIARYALAETFVNRWTNSLFFVGKFLRFGMLLFFLFLLQKNTSGLAGYSTNQVIVFFLSYQFMDTITQILYRGVYTFGWKVRSGELDFYLAKPLNPLFRILTGEPDLIDAAFLMPTTIFSIWIIAHLNLAITWSSVLLYGVLFANGLLIATALHILVVCLGVITTEVDNAIMLYRDIATLSRFPTTLYAEPIRTALFFLVPVGLMNTIPAQVLLGITPTYSMILTTMFGIGFFCLSLFVWKLSLRLYTSAGG